MNKVLVSRILAGIVILGGLLVAFGWIFDVQVLKSILPVWVTMKFITSLSFITSGAIILLLSFDNKNEWIKFSILILSFALFILMVTFFVSFFSGISTGIESLFVKEAAGAVKTSRPGVPAVPTMICFVLISLCGLIYLYNSNALWTYWIGIATLVIGGIAVVGYILGISAMQYNVFGYTSMAVHTAVLFVIVGISIVLLEKDKIIK